jgi:Peptidase family M28
LAHLDALARQPRPAGSPAAASAQDYCAEHLRSLGFTVVPRPFEYSALAGRYGAPIIGAIGATLVVATTLIGVRGIAVAAAGAAVSTAAMVLVASWLGGRDATRTRLLRGSATNLEARRGADPRLWLVAHIDSKSQPVSTAVRTLGVVLLATGVFGLAARAALLPSGLWPALPATIVACAVIGGGILVCCVVGSRSAGAADNASGVAAVLEAAAAVGPGKSFGVLITDAEELALAGARAWVIGRAPGIAINCDTIDDGGRLVVMRYGGSADLSRRALAAARAEESRAIAIRPLPGVLTDSVAFQAANWQTVTLCRGTLRTLNRIHTVRDNLHALSGTGVPAAARVLARLVEELA